MLTVNPMWQQRLYYFLVVTAFTVPFAVLVAYQARQRGYSFLTWMLAGMLGNPLFFLVMLAIMPDLARKARRRQERADLYARLADRLKVLPAATAALPPPLPPPLPPTTFVRDRSLGDQPTVLPPERSLGDEQTHA